MEDALAFLPVNGSANMAGANKIPACFDNATNILKIACIAKFHNAMGESQISLNLFLKFA